MVAMDPDVVSAVWVSVSVSLAATLLAACAGVPLGFIIGVREFRGKNLLAAGLQSMTAVPTVVVGLIGYSLFTAHGPMGPMGLLYTPAGMVLGEFLLIIPLVTALALSATQSAHTGIRDTALTLGATPVQAAAAVVRQGRFAYLTAVATGFGRAVGEVGVAMMIGGNIRGVTRTMTTTLALETQKGEFGLALALGFILLIIALFVNAMLLMLKTRAEKA